MGQNEFGGPTNIIASHLNDHHLSIRHSVIYHHRHHVHRELHAITMHLTIKTNPSSDVCTVIHSRLSTRTQFHFSFPSSAIECICQRRHSVATQLTRKTNKMCRTERSTAHGAPFARGKTTNPILIMNDEMTSSLYLIESFLLLPQSLIPHSPRRLF